MSSSGNGHKVSNGHEVDTTPSRKRKLAGDTGLGIYTTTETSTSPKSARYSLRIASFSADGDKEPLLPLATPSANGSLAVTPDGSATPSKYKQNIQNTTDGLLKRVEDYFSSLTSGKGGDTSTHPECAKDFSNSDSPVRNRSHTLQVISDEEKSKCKPLNVTEQYAPRPAVRLSNKLHTSSFARSLTLPHSESYNDVKTLRGSQQGKLTSRRDSKYRWSRFRVRQLLRKHSVPALRLVIFVFAIIGVFLRGTTRSRHVMRPPEYNPYQIPPSLGFEGGEVDASDGTSTQIRLFDFDARAAAAQISTEQHILALLPIYINDARDAVGTVQRVQDLLTQLSNIDHPHQMISIGILVVGEPTSTLRHQLDSAVDRFLASATQHNVFRRVTLLKRASMVSSSFDLEPLVTGSEKDRARSLLVFSALQADVDWVLWLDTQIKYLPNSIVQDLLQRQNLANSNVAVAAPISLSYNGVPLSSRADVVVPNLITQSPSGHVKPFDAQDWSAQGTSASNLAAAQVLLGATGLADDLHSTGGVPLRSTKATVALVRAQTHLFGVGFPSWITAEDAAHGHTSAEAFGSVASGKAGANVIGLPDYFLEMYPN